MNRFETVPDVGACTHDLGFLAGRLLDAFGVNSKADDGIPSATTILEHGITEELMTIDLVLTALEEGSIEHEAPRSVRERLSFLSDTAKIISSIYATTKGGTP